MTRIAIPGLLLLAALLVDSDAQVILFDSNPHNPASSRSMSTTNSQAQAFTVPVGGDFNLDYVELGVNNSNANVQVFLYADDPANDGTVPQEAAPDQDGVLLEDLGVTRVMMTGPIRWTSVTRPLLQAGTRYWVVGRHVPAAGTGSNTRWHTTMAGSPTPEFEGEQDGAFLGTDLWRVFNPTTSGRAMTVAATPVACAACGDCDTDGAGPTSVDVLIAAQIDVALFVPSPCQLQVCDVDSSGSIDVIDALFMARTSAGLPQTLVCP